MVEEGIKVALVGNGGSCETIRGLDHADRKDYESDLKSEFDGEEDEGETDGLSNCYKADLGGDVTGGSITWLGTGMFAPKYTEICIRLSGQEDAWCCKLENSYSQNNVAVAFKSCSQNSSSTMGF